MDHDRAPVLEALEDFRHRGDVVFAPPGHAQGRGADPRAVQVLGLDLFRDDVLMQNALDDRLQTHKVLTQALELMADAVHAEQCFFSTCGSSLSVKTAIMSVAGPGEKLLISRNAHKSVMAGVIISGIDPVWVHPHFDEELHLAHPPEPADVRAALERNPDAKGMLLITPTDWGTCADIRGTAEVCHELGVPLIVDEAWGAHLPFHTDLPTWGMDAGADLVVTSVHKMGGAIEQSSCFHLQGDRVDPSVLSAREDLLATTSSSSLVYATLDAWRRQMVQHGSRLLGDALGRAERVRAAVDRLDGLDLMGREVVRPHGAFDLDPLSFTMDVRGLGVTGFQAIDWMHAQRHVDIGGSDTRRINARLTHAHTDADVDRLIDGFAALVEAAPGMERAPSVALPSPSALEVETVMRPRDAYFARTEQVPAEEAVGRVCAEMISPYPPGVPALAPGERINAEVLEYLRTGVAAGMVLPDPVDPTAATIRVVAD